MKHIKTTPLTLESNEIAQNVSRDTLFTVQNLSNATLNFQISNDQTTWFTLGTVAAQAFQTFQHAAKYIKTSQNCVIIRTRNTQL